MEANKPFDNKKIRLVVLTDISSLESGVREPDDTQSLVRLLLYSNEFDIEGLIATYSVHLEQGADTGYIEAIVKEYGKVYHNLTRHDPRYPSESHLLSCIRKGNPKCGMEQIGEGKDTDASELIISVVDREEPRPVWFIIWGGPLDLAQALWRVAKDRSPEELARFKSKMRVYAIGDQYDASGQWIRDNHPDLFYIRARLVNRGIYKGGDTSLTSNEWLIEHVCNNHGPLGAAYPIYDGGDPWGSVKGIKEGDTTSFLYLIPNGLGNPMQPAWGSWGGRFVQIGNHYFDAKDTFDGVTHEWASTYRWRADFQADFQARMDWCVKSYYEANHAPRAVVEGGNFRTVAPGEEVILDASGSTDPDGDELRYEWFFYKEPSSYKGDLEIKGSNTACASFIAPTVEAAESIHIILTVRDNGSPSLCSYQRVVVTVDKYKKSA